MREVGAKINRLPTITCGETSPASTTFVRLLLSICHVRFVKMPNFTVRNNTNKLVKDKD
jgi:hypothetical protein